MKSFMKHLCLYCFTLAVLIWLIGFAVFCAYTFSLQPNEPTKESAIVVLTGGNHRIGTAIDVFKKTQAQHMLISGVNRQVTKNKLLKGLSEEDKAKITLGYEAENTVGNAVEIFRWIQGKNITSILLVTSFYHMPRSIFEITRQNPALHIRPWPVYPTEYEQPVDWVKTRYAWQLFLEYHKFIFVHIKLFF